MKGAGRIYTRPNSPYFWAQYYHNGKKCREVCVHVRTGEKLEAIESKRHEAERFLKNRVEQVATEKHGGPTFVDPKQQRATVGELIDALQTDFELRGKWNFKTESQFKKARDKFGLRRAVTLTSEAVAEWQLELKEQKYSHSSINKYCQVISQAFKNKRVRNALIIKHLSEIGNERKGFFTEAEINAVISHLPEYLKDFARFAYITGMRKGEVQSLKWENVTGETITLRAEDSKNGEGRTIALEGELAELIERRREARKVKDKKGNLVTVSAYIFHKKGKPVGEFRKSWATACKFANVPGRLFHDLRRCAARNLLAAGVPQAVAMKITGHKTDSMFRRYAIVTVDQQREALKAAEAYRQQQLQQERQRIAQMPARTQ